MLEHGNRSRIAQAQIAALAASAERLQQERDAVLADWSWRGRSAVAHGWSRRPGSGHGARRGPAAAHIADRRHALSGPADDGKPTGAPQVGDMPIRQGASRRMADARLRGTCPDDAQRQHNSQHCDAQTKSDFAPQEAAGSCPGARCGDRLPRISSKVVMLSPNDVITNCAGHDKCGLVIAPIGNSPPASPPIGPQCVTWG